MAEQLRLADLGRKRPRRSRGSTHPRSAIRLRNVSPRATQRKRAAFSRPVRRQLLAVSSHHTSRPTGICSRSDRAQARIRSARLASGVAPPFAAALWLATRPLFPVCEQRTTWKSDPHSTSSKYAAFDPHSTTSELPSNSRFTRRTFSGRRISLRVASVRRSPRLVASG